jgi:hypothetical protein
MPQKPESGREVIAHFSISTLLFACAGLLAFAALASVMAHDLLFAQNGDDHIKYGLHVWAFAIIGVGLIKLLAMAIRLIRSAVASHGEALWIEDGRLRHADKKVLDVATRDVTAVDLVRAAIYGTSFWPQHVTFMAVRLRDGKDIKLSASGFVENRDDVVVALREKLGLPAHDVVVMQGSL